MHKISKTAFGGNTGEQTYYANPKQSKKKGFFWHFSPLLKIDYDKKNNF